MLIHAYCRRWAIFMYFSSGPTLPLEGKEIKNLMKSVEETYIAGATYSHV